MQKGFLFNYYQDQYYNGVKYSSTERLFINKVNYKLGRPRVRQKRVNENSCSEKLTYKSVGFVNWTCFGRYATNVEETQTMRLVPYTVLFTYTDAELDSFKYKYNQGSRLSVGNEGSYTQSGKINKILIVLLKKLLYIQNLFGMFFDTCF